MCCLKGCDTLDTETPTVVATRALPRVLEQFRDYAPFQKLRTAIEDSSFPTVTGLVGSAASCIIHSLADELQRPILVVASDAETANDLYEDLHFLMGSGRVGHFPSRQILPYDFRAPVGEIMGRRISTLAGLLEGRLPVVHT